MAKESKKGIVLDEAERPAPQGANYLLAIAIDDYQYCPKLYNCVRDANDLVKLLTERYLFEPQNVTALINEEATRSNIYNALRKLASETTSRDNVLIYFSGHGEYDKIFRQGYWIPVDAPEGHYDQYIPNSEIKTILNAINSHHTFLMVDSCFAGALFAKGVGKNVSKRYEADPSRWGLTSGRNEVVSDGKPGDNSPFAESLLYRLRQNTTSLGVSELCAYVVEYVQANSNQTPIGEPLKAEGHKNGQFVFHLRKDVGVKQPGGIKMGAEPDRKRPKPALKEKPTGKKKPVPPQGMVFVNGGIFDMGDAFEDGEWDECSVHSVKVSGFYMCRFQVTVEEFSRFVEAAGYKTDVEKSNICVLWDDEKWMKKAGINWRYDEIGKLRNPDEYGNPVIYISWNDAIAYCNWLSEQHGYQKVYSINGRIVTTNWIADGYRLPTEAEWEYEARRLGSMLKHTRDNSKISRDSILEWCWDWYDESYYEQSKNSSDPRGPDTGYFRVIRGGRPFYERTDDASFSMRGYQEPDQGGNNLGFRLARTGP